MGGNIVTQATIRRAWSNPSITARAAAKGLGIARSTLWKRAKGMGLPPKPTGRRVQFDHPDFPAMWAFGVTAKEIAAHFDLHPDTPLKAARRLGLQARPKGKETMADFLAHKLAKSMAETARIEQAQIKLAEMWDQPGHNTSGKRKAA